MTQAGNSDRPIRVGVVGSGPAGWFVTGALLRSGVSVRVDIFERLPAPFGLVRYGVAPDHPEIKLVQRQFDRIASAPEVVFYGNVTVGRDLTAAELRAAYDAVVFGTGMPRHRSLNIPGEDLPGSHSAEEFVGWYNGHPGFRDREFDLTGSSAVVIGNGNVAMDVVRMLAKSSEELKGTDIADHAARQLARSRIRTIHVIGRRGPAQASFTPAELDELTNLETFAPVVDRSELDLDPISRRELERHESVQRRRSFAVLERFSEMGESDRPGRIRFLFLRSPVAIDGRDRVHGIRLARNRLEGEAGQRVAVPLSGTETIACGLAIRCIGYRGVPLDGVPFDLDLGIIPNESGRVIAPEHGAGGVYAVGWIQHGPRGLIGTTKKESSEIVKTILRDLEEIRPVGGHPEDGVRRLLESRSVRSTSYDDWKVIDLAEQERGRAMGKPREKFCAVESMLACLLEGK